MQSFAAATLVRVAHGRKFISPSGNIEATIKRIIARSIAAAIGCELLRIECRYLD
jgi:hypothetical protein